MAAKKKTEPESVAEQEVVEATEATETTEAKTTEKKAATKGQTNKKKEVEEAEKELEIVEELTEDEISDEEVEELSKELDEALKEESEGEFDSSDIMTLNERQDEEDESKEDEEKISVFYQGALASNSNELSPDEAWNNLKRIARVGAIIAVKVIGTDIYKDEKGNSVVYAVATLTKPFDYDILIPFSQFFSQKEIELRKLRRYQNNAKAQILLLSKNIGGTVNVKLSGKRFEAEKTDNVSADRKEYRKLYASRRRAMQESESKFFVSGVLQRDGSRAVVKEGDIIRNCQITSVEDNYIKVDVCGISTPIATRNLSWKYISRASDAFTVGNTVNVKIKSIGELEINGEKFRDLICSVKDLYEDETLSALKAAAEPDKLGVYGECLGKIVHMGSGRNGNYVYRIFTAKGYNALAPTRKARVGIDNRIPNPTKLPHIGSNVVFRPAGISKSDEHVMVGYIVDVLD